MVKSLISRFTMKRIGYMHLGGRDMSQCYRYVDIFGDEYVAGKNFKFWNSRHKVSIDEQMIALLKGRSIYGTRFNKQA